MWKKPQGNRETGNRWGCGERQHSGGIAAYPSKKLLPRCKDEKKEEIR